MSAFDLLHPVLQHHVVNSLGWRDLRPFQEEVIPVVLQGEHAVVIAPTAGGKTEAAMLPVLSRMLSEDWRGLSVLYLCPIRALINNLHIRLSRFATLVGRSCSVWHGDTSPTERGRIHREQPDILLTTPESIEVMLVSRKTDPAALFGQVRVVIVDELHAFAGDDRGWHMLSVLQRVSRLSGREFQRIGLSATVGNPEQLLCWLVSGSTFPGKVIQPPADTTKQPKVQLDFVGTLKNAAIVISRMHRGDKRLVFIDSRARAEQLGSELRQLDVKAYVTHSSLSKDQRSKAEEAFAAETDCVIVATSVLELGVDVGNLDWVIQIDSPTTVASFLQRMGRTGRRAGIESNCLILATTDYGLMQAAALLRLWAHGFVEEIVPPPLPYHVFIQQILTLILQNKDFTWSDWPEWIGKVPAFSEFQDGRADEILSFALQQHLIGEDGGRLYIGVEAERRLGRRYFSELLSVITSQPLIQVRYGRQELGFVHPLSFASHEGRPIVLSLGGRGWKVTHVDWNRKTAYAEPSSESGRSRWMGTSVPLSAKLCENIRDLLRASDNDEWWSQRTLERIFDIRQELAPICESEFSIRKNGNSVDWWTFAGLATNKTIVNFLQPYFETTIQVDNLWIKLPNSTGYELIQFAFGEVLKDDSPLNLNLDRDTADLLKFGDLLPEHLLEELFSTRIANIPSARKLMEGILIA